MSEVKIKTGIPGLDEMLYGGFIPHRPYIVSGVPGSGKTTLCMQFLLEGARNGENVLFVTVDEPPNEIKENMESFGWDLSKIQILDATSDVRRYDISPILDVTSRIKIQPLSEVPSAIRKTPDFESLVVTIHSLQQTIKQAIEKKVYHRVVIDSITGLKYFCMEGEDERLRIQSFMRFLSELKLTVLLTSELTEYPQFDPEIFLARGELRLHMWRENGILKRGITVEQYRGSSHDTRMRAMEIRGDGIWVETEFKPAVKAKKGKKVADALKAPVVEKVAAPAVVETQSAVAIEQKEPSVVEATGNAELDSILHSVEVALKDCTDAGLDVQDIMELVTNSRELAARHEYLMALRLAKEADSLVDLKIEIYNVHGSIEDTLVECKQVGLDTAEIEKLLAKSNEMVAQRSYREALGLAKEAEQQIEKLIADYNRQIELLETTEPEKKEAVKEQPKKGLTIVEADIAKAQKYGFKHTVTDEKVHKCPHCKKDAKYIQQYKRWYCYNCKKYL